MVDAAAESFAALLKQYRIAGGLTQEALAERAGLSVRAVSDLERGTRQHPYPHTVQRLTRALGLAEDEAERLHRAARHGPDGGNGSGTDAADDRLPAPLPIQPTSFVGREEEVDEVGAIVRRAEVRLLTLTGPGGVGKTRLALRVAEDIAGHFPDGAAFVSLASLTDPARVSAAIAGSLKVREVTGRPLLESVVEHLRDRRLLLLLDNFEHVLPAAEALSSLLASCQGLTLLVTSRTVLNLAAEHEYPVTPLPTPVPGHLPSLDSLGRYDAVRLFVRRAQAIKPDFELSEDNAQVIAEVCSRLDGLPLAIELAAARIRLLPPRALLERLADRLQVLTGGPRDVPARQQTLRNTLDWSYDLLTPREQMLFARLSVFVGGCTLDAAEAVCNPDGDLDVLDGIASLVDKSLVRQQGESESRFAMLDTVREYAADRLAIGVERDRAQAAHAAYFLDLAEQAEPELRGAQQRHWLARLEGEGANIPAALHWAQGSGEVAAGLRLATALWRFWSTTGQYSEGRSTLEALLELDRRMGRPAPAMLRAKALNHLARFADRQGDLGRAPALARESLAIYRAAGDRAGIAAALSTIGGALRQRGEYAEAMVALEECLVLRRELGDTARIPSALSNLGAVARWQGQYDRAEQLFGEALQLYTQMHDTAAAAHMLYWLGDAALDRCDYTEARRLYEESLALRSETEESEGIGFVLNGLALVAHAEGDHDRALRCAERSVELFREVGATRQISCMLDTLARIALDAGDAAQAEAAYRESLALGLEAGAKDLVPYGLEGLGRIALGEGEPERAARLYGAGAALRDTLHTPPAGHERAAYENAVRAIRLALGDAVGAAWDTGRAMPLEEAAAYALDTDNRPFGTGVGTSASRYRAG